MAHIYLTAYGVKLDVEVRRRRADTDRRADPAAGMGTVERVPRGRSFHAAAEAAAGATTSWSTACPSRRRLAQDAALHVLDSQLRVRVAALAEDRIFIHAGVVSVGGRGLLIPGKSFSGKTTLVAALIGQGPSYYSDEFAVLDAAGLAHPYPRRLSLRTDGNFREYADAGALGGRTGSAPVRPVLIAITRCSPGRRWDPEPRGPGIGALALLSNAVGRAAPDGGGDGSDLLAVEGATVLGGRTGRGGETAKLMLAALEAIEDRAGQRDAVSAGSDADRTTVRRSGHARTARRC